MRFQTYETAEITVTFDPKRCVHSGVCLRGLPHVFDVTRRRWIRPELASAAAVAAQVARCPTGALQSRLAKEAGPFSRSAMPGPTRAELLEFLRQHRLAVQASIGITGGVQAAVVGIAVSDAFEIVFDTLETTRKIRNLTTDPHIALVIGGIVDGEERSVQYEGLADRPTGSELELVQELYFRTFPDGRERLSWPGIAYVRVRPQWLRFSDYRSDPPTIVELDRTQLRELK